MPKASELNDLGRITPPADWEVLAVAHQVAAAGIDKRDAVDLLDLLDVRTRLVPLAAVDRSSPSWLARLITKFKPVGELQMKGRKTKR